MKLDSLINNLPNLFYRVKNDKNWTAEYISEGCYKLTGYKSEEFIKSDKIKSVNPVSRIEDAKLKMICFLL